MDGISIIIPVKGALNLKTLINSIDYDLCEIIIVGNDESNIKLYSEKVKFIKSDAKRSAARNMGVNNAKYNFLLFLDADMELTKNFIKNALFDINGYDALIFPEMTTGKSIIAKGRKFERSGLYKSLYYEAPRMVKKNVFLYNKGYDVKLDAFEDLDFTRKLLQNNFKIGWSDNFIIHHEEDINFFNYIKKRMVYTKGNKIIFSKKDQKFFKNLTKFGNRYNAFINSIRIYKFKSIYYIPFYFVVTLINVLIFTVIK